MHKYGESPRRILEETEYDVVVRNEMGDHPHFYLKKEIIKIENTKTELPKILK